jgi:DNA-directed RNA polymerase subunit alpha
MTVNTKNWQELKKPNSLEIKSWAAMASRKATFVAEPLERGFGLTLGNALRRVLLSSLQGAAITSIKIENVLHEFSSLAGVREDVTDIVLNVKQIALKMEGEGPKRLQLSVTGPATVKAGDIAVSGDIEVMNPDLVICHLDQGASLNMEMTADTGKGYVPAVANRPADAPIGLIPVDSLVFAGPPGRLQGRTTRVSARSWISTS